MYAGKFTVDKDFIFYILTADKLTMEVFANVGVVPATTRWRLIIKSEIIIIIIIIFNNNYTRLM